MRKPCFCLCTARKPRMPTGLSFTMKTTATVHAIHRSLYVALGICAWLCGPALATELTLPWLVFPNNEYRDDRAHRVSFDVEGPSLVIRAHLSDPNSGPLIATRTSPDGMEQTSTSLTVYIDVTGTGQRALLFAVNPLGSIVDGHFQENQEWKPFGFLGGDFQWTVHTDKHATGWSAEIRIPVSELRLIAGVTPKVFVRYTQIGRENQSFMSGNPRDHGGCRLCAATPVPELAGVTGVHNAWQLEPGLYVDHLREQDGPQKSQSQHTKLSLNAHWHASSALELRATINPNFVERSPDNPVVGYSSQFAPELDEKRQFFARTADALQTPGMKLYNTRSIGQPQAALAADWQSEGWRGVGLVSQENAGGKLLVPGTYSNQFLTLPQAQTTLLKAAHTLESFDWGLGLLNRNYQALGSSQLWHLQARKRWEGGHTLFGVWSASQTDVCAVNDSLASCAKEQGHGGSLKYQMGLSKGQWDVQYSEYSPGFRADMGWIGQTGIRKWELHGEYVWEKPLSGYSNFTFYPVGVWTRNWQGQSIEQRAGLEWVFVRESGVELGLVLNPWSHKRLQATANLESSRTVSMWAGGVGQGWLNQMEGYWEWGEVPDYAHALPGRGWIAASRINIKLSESLSLSPQAQWMQVKARPSDPSVRHTYSGVASLVALNWQYSTFARWRYIYTHNAQRLWDFDTERAEPSKDDSHALLWEDTPRAGWGKTFSLAYSRSPLTQQNRLEAVAKLKYVM